MQIPDNIEAFIQNHREDFDDQIPPSKVWVNIDVQLHGQPTRRPNILRVLSAIAAAIALLLTGAVGGARFFQPTEALVAQILEESNPEFLEAEQYYQHRIAQKVAQLAAFNPDEVVLADLKHVDVVMDELKKELATAPKGKEQVIIAKLIQSYQTKIAILELVLQRAAEIDTITHKNPHRHEISL